VCYRPRPHSVSRASRSAASHCSVDMGSLFRLLGFVFRKLDIHIEGRRVFSFQIWDPEGGSRAAGLSEAIAGRPRTKRQVSSGRFPTQKKFAASFGLKTCRFRKDLASATRGERMGKRMRRNAPRMRIQRKNAFRPGEWLIESDEQRRAHTADNRASLGLLGHGGRHQGRRVVY